MEKGSTVKRRHPVMGFFGGLMFGIGIALMLFVFGIVPISALWFGILAIGCAVLGVVLAYVVPARKHTAPA
jgi:multisubunit Na+/H+ antiporter MnhB subunit